MMNLNEKYLEKNTDDNGNTVLDEKCINTKSDLQYIQDLIAKNDQIQAQKDDTLLQNKLQIE